MPEWLPHLFSSDGFMPHGHCYLWNPTLIWLHVVSDALIALAYISIPFTLAHLGQKRRDIPFNWMFFCFGTFIVACGATHAMEIWTLWTPVYWLSGAVKAVTAAASVSTAILLIKLVPQALAVPSAGQLSKAHEELRLAHEALELRVQERTAELSKKNADLARELAERMRAEQSFVRSEKRFRRLMESGVIGIVLSDTEGNIHEANDTFLATVGYSREDLLAGRISGKNLNTPDRDRTDRVAVGQLRAHGIAHPWEKELVRKDGNRVPVLNGLVMLDDGECVTFVLDLTERRRAEKALNETEARKAAVMEAALDAIVMMDDQGRITEFNPAAEQLFGYSVDEAIGKPLSDLLIPPALRTRHLEGLHRYLTKGDGPILGKRIEVPATRRDGREFPAEVAVVRIRAEGPALFTGYIRDITERRKAAEAEVLRREKQAAEEANAELEAFSYSVAHDLRAPLRAIHGFSSILAAEYGPKLDDDAKEFLGRIQSGADRLSNLIDALLSLSRLARAEPSRQRIDLSALARKVMDQLQSYEPNRSVDFVVADEAEAEGDPLLVRALLENLLGNAWKFSGKRSAARVEFGREEADGVPAFYVRDNGAGFDMALAQKLFTPFRRLHSEGEFEGTGIGLATVQRIVRRHGGRIWAEGAVGEGATFHFTLSGSRRGS